MRPQIPSLPGTQPVQTIRRAAPKNRSIRTADKGRNHERKNNPRQQGHKQSGISSRTLRGPPKNKLERQYPRNRFERLTDPNDPRWPPVVERQSNSYIREKLTMNQGRFIFSGEAEALAYWSSREWKKFVVTVTAGPTKRPTFNLKVYVRAKTREGAIECAKRNLTKKPGGARYNAWLASPSELGCQPTPTADKKP